MFHDFVQVLVELTPADQRHHHRHRRVEEEGDFRHLHLRHRDHHHHNPHWGDSSCLWCETASESSQWFLTGLSMNRLHRQYVKTAGWNYETKIEYSLVNINKLIRMSDISPTNETRSDYSKDRGSNHPTVRVWLNDYVTPFTNYFLGKLTFDW